MSWQADLKRYMDLKAEIVTVEATTNCTCDSNNFYTCEQCKQVALLWVDSRRLLDLWGDVWACKLWRIAQGIEPPTSIYFGKEPSCQTTELKS